VAEKWSDGACWLAIIDEKVSSVATLSPLRDDGIQGMRMLSQLHLGQLEHGSDSDRVGALGPVHVSIVGGN